MGLSAIAACQPMLLMTGLLLGAGPLHLVGEEGSAAGSVKAFLLLCNACLQRQHACLQSASLKPCQWLPCCGLCRETLGGLGHRKLALHVPLPQSSKPTVSDVHLHQKRA